ncbi:MAG: hypothetical protein AAB612_03165 [Patescibacteria group bacterium]
MAGLLDALKTYTLDQLAREIDIKPTFGLETLNGILKLFQHPRFEELVTVWITAGETAGDFRKYQELAHVVQRETNLSDVVLGYVLKWYYDQSQVKAVSQPQ